MWTVRFDDLLHSFATNGLARGVDMEDVATRLGHASTRITHHIYRAPSSRRDARAAELVAGLSEAGGAVVPAPIHGHGVVTDER